MPEDLLQPGESVGSYRIITRVGRGGMGDVYKALEPALERTVALKVMAAGLAQDKQFVDRFKTEAKAAAALVHPNVVNVFGVGEHRGMPYIAMEYVEGESLQQKILRDKKLHPAHVLNWAVQACRGLEAAAKKGVVHRDIKPANLMIDREGNLKIADFGLAKLQKSDVSLTQTGVAVGTPLYMSPEQGRGEKIDLRADIYALGATMYHALSGRPPFEGDTPIAVISKHALTPVTPLHTLRPDLPEALSGVIGKMMAKAPADRHANYEKLVADLERLKTAVPAAAAAPAGVSGEDRKFGMVAVKSGMITEAQLKGALQLQEKLRGQGKAKGLAEILVAAKILTADQREILQNSGLHQAWSDATDESSGSNPTLEVTEVARAAAAKPADAKNPSCMLCKLEVRPEQVQTVCEECGARQHAECFTSFGGCGNEQCPASPRSIVGRKPGRDESLTSAPLTFKEKLQGMMWPLIGAAVLLLGGLAIWKFTYKSAQDLYNEAKALEGGAGKGRLSIFSIDEANKDVSAGTMGLTGETQRRLEQQVDLYQKALAKEERFVPARYELAKCLLQLSRHEQALQEFEKVLQYDARHKEAMLGAGVLHMTAGNDSRAEAYFQKAAEAGSPEAWLNLAVLFQDKKKESARAIEPLRSYLKSNDGDGNAWARLATALMDAGNDSEASAAADRSEMNGATLPLGIIVKARLAYKAGKYEAAAAAALQATEKCEEGSMRKFEALRIAGNAYLKAGRPQPARQMLHAARAINSTDIELLVGLAELGVQMGDWADASIQYRDAFNRGSKNFEHLFLAGKYAFLQPQAMGAPAIFEDLAQRKSDYPDIKLWLAKAYLKAGSIESIGPAVQRAVEEKPDDPERKALKVWELFARASFQEAADLAEKHLQDHPQSAELHLRAAEAYAKLRKNDQAVTHWRAAADAGDQDALYALGDFYAMANNRTQATEFLQKYLDRQSVGPMAERARQLLQAFSSSTGTTGYTVRWEPVVEKVVADLAKTIEPKHEAVDLVYMGVVACMIEAYAYGERYTETAGAVAEISAAELYLDQGLSQFASSTAQVQADARVRRIRDRYAQIAFVCDRLVPAMAAAAQKANPSASSAIDAIVAAYGTAAPKDPFDKTSFALEHVVKIWAAARGEKAREVLDYLDAQLLVASNVIQVTVARLYACCRLAALGHAKEKELLEDLERSDDAVGTGLGQLRVGFYSLAGILEVLRK